MILDSVLDRPLAWRGRRWIWNNPDYAINLFLTYWTVTIPPSLLGTFVAGAFMSCRSVHEYCIYFVVLTGCIDFFHRPSSYFLNLLLTIRTLSVLHLTRRWQILAVVNMVNIKLLGESSHSLMMI